MNCRKKEKKKIIKYPEKIKVIGFLCSMHKNMFHLFIYIK